MIDAQDIRTVEAFADMGDEDVRWLGEQGEHMTLEVGETFIHQDEPVDQLFAILEGEIHLVRVTGPPDDRWIVRSAGEIVGMLPLSRMTHSPVAGRALVPTRIAAYTTPQVTEMLERMPVLHSRLAAIMLDRSREFARLDEQGQRLQSLGTLSAGLAHELNNPASAIQRRLDDLAQRVGDLSDLAAEGLAHAVGRDRLAPLRDLATSAPRNGTSALDALQRSDDQEALRSWLERRGLPDAWRTAETLASTGLTTDDLEIATASLADDAVRTAARWLEADRAARGLLDDVAEATTRIVDLIASVKTYANLDRAPIKTPLDLNEGIRSTLAMMRSKLSAKDLEIATDLDPSLPLVRANAGELNQVWTNLIDNAIDASPPAGILTIESSAGPDTVVVRIIDGGQGIPEDLQRKIFEPFFTTKGVGDGTGIGLDIVHRLVRAHGGDVRVESTPGTTCFEVRLPIAPATTGTS